MEPSLWLIHQRRAGRTGGDELGELTAGLDWQSGAPEKAGAENLRYLSAPDRSTNVATTVLNLRALNKSQPKGLPS